MKYAAGGLQPRETIHNFSQPGAVELRQPGEIKNNARMAVTEQLIEGQLELLALDASLERTGELEDEDSRPEFFFYDLQRPLPIKTPLVSRGVSGGLSFRTLVRKFPDHPNAGAERVE